MWFLLVMGGDIIRALENSTEVAQWLLLENSKSSSSWHGVIGQLRVTTLCPHVPQSQYFCLLWIRSPSLPAFSSLFIIRNCPHADTHPPATQETSVVTLGAPNLYLAKVKFIFCKRPEQGLHTKDLHSHSDRAIGEFKMTADLAKEIKSSEVDLG